MERRFRFNHEVKNMRFDIITIFPEIFDSYLKESIIKRAQDKGLIKINLHNLRDYTDDPHRVIDDRPYGGGIGMIFKLEPIYKAVKEIKRIKRLSPKKRKVILFTPRGKRFNQKKALEFSKLDQLILICGRYEGIDERVAKYIADETLSLGNFVLLGGEIASMAVIEAVARLIPGVIGKPQLLKERITKQGGFLEYPQYTRPEVFESKLGKKWKVSKVLLSGNHKEIEKWRKKHSKIIG